MSWYTFGEILAFVFIAAIVGGAIGMLVAGLLRFSKVKVNAARRCRDEQRVREARHMAEMEGLEARLVAMAAEVEVANAEARHWRDEYDRVTTQLEVTYAQTADALGGIDQLRSAYDQRRAEVEALRAAIAAEGGSLPPAAP